VNSVTAVAGSVCYLRPAMDETVKAVQPASRLAYLLESLAIVLLAALAAYAAS
jgi:hypothetical protein